MPASDGSSMTLQIDGGISFSINDTVTGTYKQWFQTPKLSDGSHMITVTYFKGTQIDFAVVNSNVGNQTRLAGRHIIVDNESPSILYSGHWSRNTSQFHSDGFGNPVYPYGNSTHHSSTPGDIFAFQFTGALVGIFTTTLFIEFVAGTSISVYGISSQFNLGTLAATYTIDGAT